MCSKLKNIISILFFHLAFSSNAQLTENCKILTGDLAVKYTQSKNVASGNNFTTQIINSSNFALGSNINYGKFKKNSMWSYGVSFTYTINKSTFNLDPNYLYSQEYLSIRPNVNFTKFIKLGENLYYTPKCGFRVDFNYQLNDRIRQTNFYLYATPISLTYETNHKINYFFNVGTLSLYYEHSNNFGAAGINKRQVITDFGFSAFLGNIGFGIQKIL